MKKVIKNKKIKKQTAIKKTGAGVKKTAGVRKTKNEKIIPENNIAAKEKTEKEIPSVKNAENDFLVLETFDFIPSEEERTMFYFGIALSAVAAIVFGWQRNFTAALLFVFIIAVMLMFLAKKPSRVTIKLDKEYFWLNDEKYNVFNLEYFWFTEQYGVKYLNIRIKKSIIKILSIAIIEPDINKLRLAFLNFIPEISPEELEEGVLEKSAPEKKAEQNGNDKK